MSISFYPLIKRALKRELKNAVNVDLGKKFITVSDWHLGKKDGADQFKQCEESLLLAFKHYEYKGYYLVIAGDLFEMTEQDDIEKIIKLYEHIFASIKRPQRFKGVCILDSNHNPKLLQCDYVKNIITKNLYKSIKYNNILITHGHRGEINIPFTNLGIRIFAWLQRKDYLKSRDLKRTANDISRRHCNNLHKAQQALKINLICGHTHNPRIEHTYINLHNKKPITSKFYANSGFCSYLNGSVDVLEYTDGILTLQKFKK